MNTRTSTIGTLTTGQSTIVTFLLAGLVLSAIPHASSVARGGERMGVLSGRIVSLDGQPVEHAHVTLEQLDLPKVEAVSGPDGRFRMPLEPVCHVRWLFVDADGFARERWDDVTVFPNRANDLGDIALWKGRRLQGHVLDLDGKPRAGVRVIAESARYALCHSSNPIGTWETTTEGDGSFVTHPLPLGVVYVKAMCAERQLAETTTKIVPGSGDQRLDPIRLQKDQPLVGIVVDEQGQPIEGVDVSSQIPVPRVVSDKTGRFPIRGYGPGMPFSPDFVKAGYFDDLPGGWFNDLKVDRATSSVTFTLKKAVPFEGRVVDAETGKPVAIRRIGLCDAVRKPDGKIETTRCALLKFQQPEPGHFRAALTRRGDYLLTVMAEGYDNFEEFVPGDTRGSARTFRLRKEIPNQPEQVSQHLEAADNGLRQERVAGIIRYRGKPVADAWVSLCPAWAKEENLMNAAVRPGAASRTKHLPGPSAFHGRTVRIRSIRPIRGAGSCKSTGRTARRPSSVRSRSAKTNPAAWISLAWTEARFAESFATFRRTCCRNCGWSPSTGAFLRPNQGCTPTAPSSWIMCPRESAA
jgi:hypothetical protein